MCALLVKSIDSLKSANFLYEETHYNSSIHCAYYSCFQLLKHIVLNILNDVDYDFNVKNGRQGSHIYTINKVGNDIAKDPVKFRKNRELKNKIYELKKIRTRADYDLDIISEKESREAVKGLAPEICQSLKNIYNI